MPDSPGFIQGLGTVAPLLSPFRATTGSRGRMLVQRSTEAKIAKVSTNLAGTPLIKFRVLRSLADDGVLDDRIAEVVDHRDGEHAAQWFVQARTQREAKVKAAELRTDATRGRYVSPRRLTVASYLQSEWLPARENADLSPNSRDVERVMVRAWILPRIGDVELQKLTPRHLDRLYADLRAEGGRGGTPLRGKSVRNVHVLLSKALADAVRRGHLVSSPTVAVDPPARDDSVSRTAWSREEAVRFLETAAADRLHAIWRLVLATGLRRGELLGLTWDGTEEGSALIVARCWSVPEAGRSACTSARRRRATGRGASDSTKPRPQRSDDGKPSRPPSGWPSARRGRLTEASAQRCRGSSPSPTAPS